MFSLWSAAVCFPNLRRAFATQVAYTFRPEEGKGVSQQHVSSPLVSARGVSAFERMIEPGCLGAVPKWMKKTGLGFCVVEADGRFNRISHPDLRYNIVAAEKVRLASSTIVTVTLCASSLGGRRTTRVLFC